MKQTDLENFSFLKGLMRENIPTDSAYVRLMTNEGIMILTP